jgi:hypothetical protein
VAGIPPAARADTIAGSVVPTDGPTRWFGNDWFGNDWLGNVMGDRRAGLRNGEVGSPGGLMLGGPDGSDATDPNDPLDVAIASLVAGRAATVAPDTVAVTAIVISAAATKR